MVVAEWCSSNLRDEAGWQSSKLPLTTTSSEAAKEYDAILRQVVAWLDEDTLGGIAMCMERMVKADPYFIMGRCLTLGLDLLGTGRSPVKDKQFGEEIEKLVADAATDVKITERERKHVLAVDEFSKGNMHKCCHIYESILADHPTDMHALKYVGDLYFYLGESTQIRDSVLRVRAAWNSKMPLANYLDGMLAFGYEESNQFREGEDCARKALTMQKHDAWATHALAHVFEMEGRHDEGIRFMTATLDDWRPCNYLACHNTWHWAVYHIEKGEHTVAQGIFDREVSKRCESGAMLDIVDATSLLYRLQLEGHAVKEEDWKHVYSVCAPHLDEHITVFNDAMMTMGLLGAHHDAQHHRQSLDKFLRDSAAPSTQKGVYRAIGVDLLDGMQAFGAEEFERAADLLYPIREQIVKIGGSNAQRDVFAQLVIHACILSPTAQHSAYAKQLIADRLSGKPNSPLTERMAAKWQAIHAAK